MVSVQQKKGASKETAHGNNEIEIEAKNVRKNMERKMSTSINKESSGQRKTTTKQRAI